MSIVIIGDYNIIFYIFLYASQMIK
jgi:hypothetical protein